MRLPSVARLIQYVQARQLYALSERLVALHRALGS